MYVTDRQIDQAADIIQSWVAAWDKGPTPFASLGDACVWAAGEVQKAWGLGFLCEYPELDELPNREQITGKN